MVKKIKKPYNILKKVPIVQWNQLKLDFFISPYKSPHTFIREHADPAVHILSNDRIAKHTANWSVEKLDWEQEAIKITMTNLRETKSAELVAFITEESAIVKQMLNLVKIGLNGLVKERVVNGKKVYKLTNAKEFKAITDGALNILKYNRSKLGVPFDKEEGEIDKQINFNFDMINLDEVDAPELFNIFNKKNKNGQTDKTQYNGDDTKRVLEAEATP